MRLQNNLEKIIQGLNRKWILLVFALLVLPSVFAPYHSDDYFQLLLLGNNSSIERNDHSLWGLFSFVDEVPAHRVQMLQYGVLPWFADEDFYFRFFRPLTEVTHWIDFHLFGINPLPAHIQSIIWFLLLSTIVYQLVKKTFPDERKLPLLALAIFVWDGQHVATIGWIANRNALVAAFFAALMLYSHMLWRESGKKRYLSAALSLLIVALLAGEIALGILAYLFFYAIIVDAKGVKKSLFSVMPYFLLVGVWYYLYQYFGFGVNTSAGLYLNPFTDVFAYITAILYRVPIYFAAAILPVPAGLSWGGGAEYPWLSNVFYVFALLVISVFYLCFNRFIRNNKVVAFWFFGAVFSLLPVCATMAQDRLALFQTIGFDIVIAALILASLNGKNVWPEKYNKYIATVLVFIHLLMSPLHLLAGSIYIHMGAKKIAENALSISQSSLAKKQLICFQVPIGEAISLMGIREVAGVEKPESFLWLANDEGRMSITVVDANDIVVKKDLGFANGFESAFRSVKKRPFNIGQLIVTSAGIIEIEHINKYQYPDRIRMHFDRKLQDEELLFYTFTKGQYQKLVLPAVGKTLVLN